MINPNTDTPPLVSCIIPTYGRESRLKNAIDSVLNQTYRPLELIIVDDASSNDYASDTIQNISAEHITVQLIQHEKNKGASAARNSGIHSANGTYIAFLDDDDQWLASKIKKQVTMLEQSNSSFSYCWVQRVGSDGIPRAEHTPDMEGNCTKELFTGNFTGTTSGLIVTKKLCKKINGFDTSFPRWNDWDFALRASKHTEFCLKREILVHQFNWEGEQLSDDLAKLKTARNRFITKHQDLAIEYDMSSVFWSRMHFALGYSAGMSDNYQLARRSMVNAIKFQPLNIEFYLYLLAFIGGKFTLLPAQLIRRAAYRSLQ